ncbi:exonuclease domain-containing protein [Thermogemmatispora sp.]|uniref:exonuclease domain-containing protein n=1 Tax=Thermogemmatispora sp. TaxID=1968838 RepID=UPI001D83FF89|nr:exonuclease domain-containing protein [Thermogemmatispora sp.]MBX5450432.1 UvrB/UvrC motif-containing protein [Thermogemmatispora sp.]
MQCLQTKGRPNLERFWHPLIGRQLASLDFVALDTETTGLRLGWDCILELGAWRRLHKEEIRGHFHSLVNPQGPVPRAIAHLTGLDERSLTAAPGIEKPLPELLRFCKGAILVGHNLTFDWRFLAHEATRCNLPWLLEGLDLLTLARYLLSDQRRFSLALLASRLHLPLTPPHRSLADAEATALVFIRSLWLSQQSAPRSARPLSTPGQSTEQAAIRQIETSMAKKKDGDAVSSRSPRLETLPLNPAWRCTFPSQPGVYLMKDSQGQVLYVGKARCLRRRLASYYHQRSVFNPRIARLLQQVQAIETRPLGSELEALLVESQLIKELQPPYNIQLRDYAHYPFLKIDVQHAFPRLTITRQSETDGARYFGPFRSGRSVELTLELLQRLFPLPTCTRPLPPEAAPSTPCLRYHLGRCLAPCTGQLAADRYHQLIEEVSAFLAGERPELLVRVRHQMEQAAEELQYERAALLRDMLHSTEEVLISQRLINSAIATHNLLIAYPSAWEGQNELFLIRHGRLIELQRAPHEEQATRYTLRRLLARAAQLQQPPATVGQAEIDQIIIITRWIKQHSRDQAFFPFTSQTLRAPEASEELIERIWQTLSTRQGGWD